MRATTYVWRENKMKLLFSIVASFFLMGAATTTAEEAVTYKTEPIEVSSSMTSVEKTRICYLCTNLGNCFRWIPLDTF